MDKVNYSGSYWQGEGVSPEIRETINAYLALAAETQDLLAQQLDALRDDPVPAVVLIYGDHNPSFGGAALAFPWTRRTASCAITARPI
jgi:hypothetical protein